MRSWRIVSVVPVDSGLYTVQYVLDEKEKHIVTVSDNIGLERALTETGVLLASRPKMQNVRLTRN